MKKISKIILGLFLIIGMTSCELFGLDYSESADFTPQESNNKVNMNALEFIKSRPDIFSSLLDAIEYAGVEDIYLESGNTYILLTNNALSNWESNDKCYWSREKVQVNGALVRAGSWDQYDKKKVAELLKYHVIKGEYSYHNLTSAALWTETFGEGSFDYAKDGQTLKGDTAVVSLMLGYDRNLPLQLNNYDWNYRGLLAAANASCRTTNLHINNGYAHVTDFYLERPTRKFLGQK